MVTLTQFSNWLYGSLLKCLNHNPYFTKNKQANYRTMRYVSGLTWGGGARAMPGGMTKLGGGDLGEATAFGPWDPKETPEVLKLVLRHRPLDLTLAGGWWTMCWGGGPESEGIWNEAKKFFKLSSGYLFSLFMCRLNPRQILKLIPSLFLRDLRMFEN